MQAIWYLSLSAQVVALVRSQNLGILPWFRVYLLSDLVRSAILLAFGRTSHAYDVIWSVSEPTLLALQIAVALECCRRIRVTYPDIGRVGEVILWACSGAAVIAGAVSIISDLNGADWSRPLTTFVALAKQGFATLIAALLVGLLVWMRAVPSDAPRNTLLHVRVLAAFFALIAATYAAIYAGIPRETAGTLMLTGVTVCFAVWAVALSRAGEILPEPSRIVTDADIDASGEVLSAHVRAVKSVTQS